MTGAVSLVADGRRAYFGLTSGKTNESLLEDRRPWRACGSLSGGQCDADAPGQGLDLEFLGDCNGLARRDRQG